MQDKLVKDDLVVDTVDEMSFTLTMADGSKKIMRFTLKDARLIPDQTTLEFNTDKSMSGQKKTATIAFNWAAFNCEIIDL